MENQGDKDAEKREMWQAYGRFSGAGFQMAVATLLGIFGGKFLDEKLATKPLFLIVGGLLGMIAGFYSIYQLLRKPKDE